ncbi:MAG: O-antigen ligase family protein [Patescibacteria group bacterium]|nr:O-antigen ligase family protein [Patescibacteria group bacterium]
MLNKYFKFTLLGLLAVEILSLIGYNVPIVNLIGFFVIAVIVLVLSFYKLEYGFYILLAELFVGSKGYLFYFDDVSIRIVLFVIVFGVWLGRFLVRRKSVFLKSSLRNYWLILMVFVLWGIVRGFLNGNEFSNIFLDANAWIFLLLIFPAYDVIKNDLQIKNVFQILFAAVLFLSLKTLASLFIFTNFGWEIGSWSFDFYRWIRETGVGEVTLLDSGFYRVFFQSQIWVLIGLLILLCRDHALPRLYTVIAIVSILFAAILTSLSRSFWLGGAVGLLFIFILIKKKLHFLIKIISAGLISFLIITLISPSFLSTISGRVQDSGEVAVSSRWNLLPPLWENVKSNWFLGSGFGTTVAYKTEDPKVLEQNPSGWYTTYAFEWGYLDIWLKIGIFGLLAYLVLIGKIFYEGFLKIKERNLNIGLLAGLVALCAVSIFSPYLNHPLGIGYVVLLSVIFKNNIRN